MSSSRPQIIRPKPRRPFETQTPQQPPSPLLSPSFPDDTPSRTHSILNLTSSTLLGIYSPTGYQYDREELSTPWGTGAETPNLSSSHSPNSSPTQTYRRKSIAPPPPAPSTAARIFSLGLRSVLLFGMGMSYGLLVRHLHDDRQLAPFQVEGIMKPSNDWRYLVFWGVSGVALGSLLPWVDMLWEENRNKDGNMGEVEERSSSPNGEEESLNSGGIFGADWTPVVRSVGAFVGIAFAIRKLPWTSSLQASLTLFLVNPVLWYVIDRSKAGFILSSAVGATGTALLLASNPDMMPSPTSSSSSRPNGTDQHPVTADFGGYVSRESVEGGIWILSVIFCSCVCFGNIGRRLALSGGRERAVARQLKEYGQSASGAVSWR